MQILRRSFLFGAASMSLCGVAAAQDGHLHGASIVEGDVTAVSPTGFELKTKTGTTKVLFSSKTKVESNKIYIDKAKIKKGDHVGVAGPKQPTGEIMASEVVVGYKHEEDHDHKDHAHKDGKAHDHKH